MDSSVDDKIIRRKFFRGPKSSGTLLGRLPLPKKTLLGDTRSGLNSAKKFTKFTIFHDSLAKYAKFANLTVFRDDLAKTTKLKN